MFTVRSVDDGHYHYVWSILCAVCVLQGTAISEQAMVAEEAVQAEVMYNVAGWAYHIPSSAAFLYLRVPSNA